MSTIYEDQSSVEVLLVDASNAFNSINMNAFLHNIIIIFPPLARYSRNCYYVDTWLFIVGGCEIQSMEGTTQDDPTSMAIYTMAIIPLALMLVEEVSQVANTIMTAAYTDDLTAAGTISSMIIRLRNCCDTRYGD